MSNKGSSGDYHNPPPNLISQLTQRNSSNSSSELHSSEVFVETTSKEEEDIIEPDLVYLIYQAFPYLNLSHFDCHKALISSRLVIDNGTLFTLVPIITDLVNVQTERIIAILSHLANYDYSEVVRSLEDLSVPHSGHTPKNIYYKRLSKQLVNQYLEDHPIPPSKVENLERDFPTTFVSYSKKKTLLSTIVLQVLLILITWHSLLPTLWKLHSRGNQPFQLTTKSFQEKLLD